MATLASNAAAAVVQSVRFIVSPLSVCVDAIFHQWVVAVGAQVHADGRKFSNGDPRQAQQRTPGKMSPPAHGGRRRKQERMQLFQVAPGGGKVATELLLHSVRDVESCVLGTNVDRR